MYIHIHTYICMFIWGLNSRDIWHNVVILAWDLISKFNIWHKIVSHMFNVFSAMLHGLPQPLHAFPLVVVMSTTMLCLSNTLFKRNQWERLHWELHHPPDWTVNSFWVLPVVAVALLRSSILHYLISEALVGLLYDGDIFWKQLSGSTKVVLVSLCIPNE